MKAKLQNVGLLFASLLLSLLVIELGLRIWGPDVLALGNQYVFYKFDPVLGWSNLPKARGRFSRLEFSDPVAINSLGMRDKEVGSKQPGEFRVAFLGDSFTWGVGAAYGERFTEVAESLSPHLNALNFGVSGYSPVQYMLELDRVLRLDPDYVIVAFCLGNDLTDNVEYFPYNHPKPYAKLSADGSKLVIAGYPLPQSREIGIALIGALSYSRLVGLIELAYDHVRNKAAEQRANGRDIVTAVGEQWLYVAPDRLTTRQQESVAYIYKVDDLILAKMRRRIDNAIGPGRFAVLLVPTKFEFGIGLHLKNADPTAVVHGMLASLDHLGIPAINGMDVITPADFWNHDGHWRPSGHRKIGALLAKYIDKVRAGGLPEAPSSQAKD